MAAAAGTAGWRWEVRVAMGRRIVKRFSGCANRRVEYT